MVILRIDIFYCTYIPTHMSAMPST